MTFAGPIGHWVVDEVKDGWGCSVKLHAGWRQAACEAGCKALSTRVGLFYLNFVLLEIILFT